MQQISDELSAPLWSARMAETKVLVQDGDTIFIGGLITENDVDAEKKIPVLGDLPLLDKVFSHNTKTKVKTELVFFVSVNLIKDGLDSMRKGNAAYSNEEIIQIVDPERFAAMKKEQADKKKKKQSKPVFDFRKKETSTQ